MQMFYANKSLSDKQLDKLQQIQAKARQNSGKQAKALSKWRLVLALAASVAMLFVLISPLHTPSVVSHAYADIIKDSVDHTQRNAEISGWLLSNDIKEVPSRYQVEMAKYCYLDKDKTVHLRVAGTEQGKLHLFFHQGEGIVNRFNNAGKHDDMHWKLLKVKQDLTLLVLYTQDMREASVNHIIGTMTSVTG